MRVTWPLILLPLLACSTVHRTGAGEPPASPAAATVGGESSRDTLQGRAMVVQASVRVEREDPEAGPARAMELARAHGGYVQHSSKQSATVRVPAERLEAFLEATRTLGRVEEVVLQRDDVTEAYQDLQVRLDNLRRTRERYLALLERASNVTETVAVERELERVTAEYEALKARLDRLEGAIASSTVQLSFARPVRPGPIGWIFHGLFVGLKWLLVWD